MSRYKNLQTRAQRLGVNTINDRNSNPMGYWLVNKDGTSVWGDGCFASSLGELETLIDEYEAAAREEEK